MRKKKVKDWFKIKRYPHIGLPLNPNDRYKWIEKYVTDPESIAVHSFPLDLQNSIILIYYYYYKIFFFGSFFF
jgi:hypothetical protein